MCLTTLLLFAAAKASIPPLSLDVVAPADVTDSLVKRICTEAQAIWGDAGIAFACERHGSKDEAGGWTIEVTVDDRHTPLGRDASLGWILFTNQGADRSIHLSRASAEALLRSTPDITDSTRFLHEALIGRALGRALAHELGHYIFQSRSHTARGLMRADWSSDEIFALNREGFELTSQERATAADHSWLDMACHSRAPRVASC
jgi:hypothetical protein